MEKTGSSLPVRWKTVVAAALLTVVTVIVYLPALRAGFIWDDDQYVTQNLLLRTPAGLAQIWLAPAGVNYLPLTATVQWGQWHLWADAPAGYHWTNVGLHVLSALLLWRLLRKLGVPLAWAGGLLFAIHPLAVESVAWISELKNTLSLPFLLLAMECYLDFDAGGAQRKRAYLWSVGFFLAALLCKSSVVMFPGVLLLHAWWKRGRLTAADLKASAVFFALSLALGSVTLWLEHSRAIGPEAAPLEGIFPRTIAAGLAVAFYFFKCLWPAGLAPIYPRWAVDPPTLLQLLPWPLLVAGFCWLWTRRKTWGRHVLFGLGCFLLRLAPVLGLVPDGLSAPGVGRGSLRLPRAGSDGRVGGRGLKRGECGQAASARRADIFLGAVAALAGARAMTTPGLFRSPETLWVSTLRQNPGAWSAHNDLGTIRYDAGRLPEAIAAFEQAVRLNTGYAEARNNLGVALASSGRWGEAIAQYEQALRFRPTYANACCNLGNALLQTGRVPAAVARYRDALRLKPDFPEAHYNLGLALQALGRPAEAAAEFAQARGLSPGP